MTIKKEKKSDFMDTIKEYEFNDIRNDIIECTIMLLNAKKLLYQAKINVIKESDKTAIRIDDYVIGLEKAFTDKNVTLAKELLSQVLFHVERV